MPETFVVELESLFLQAGTDGERLFTLLSKFLAFHDLYSNYQQGLTREKIDVIAQRDNKSEYSVFLQLLRELQLQRTSELTALLISFIFPETPAQAVPGLLLLTQLGQEVAAVAPDTQTKANDGASVEQTYKENISHLLPQLIVSIMTARLLCIDLAKIWGNGSKTEEIFRFVQKINTELHQTKNLLEKVRGLGSAVNDVLVTTNRDSFDLQRLQLIKAVVTNLNHSIGNRVASALTRAQVIGKLLQQPDRINAYQAQPVELMIQVLTIAYDKLLPFITSEGRQTLFESPATLLIPNKEADLNQVLDMIVNRQLQESLFLPQHIELIMKPHSTPLRIMVSDLSMSSIMTNLLGNAIRHMPNPGTITIKIYSATRPQDQKPFAILDVIDEGEGITLEVLPYIFQDGFSHRGPDQLAGTGQGLSIVKEAVERHHGFIKVMSQVGVGTTFRMAFPLLEEDKQTV